MNKLNKIYEGDRFGSLVIIKETIPKKDRRWLCQCDCGNVHEVIGYNLLSGHTSRCRYCSIKASADAKRKYPENTKHLYSTWRAMNRRCYNPEDPGYYNYGGRGIKVCKEWRDTSEEGFTRFVEDIGEKPSQKHTLDRKDNNGDYCKNNCRWATQREQANNTRRNSRLTYDGETKTIAEWSDILGVKQNTLTYRKLRGWSDEEVIEGSRKDIFQGLKVIVPLEVFLERKTKEDRKYLINLNQYRNWQGHENNNVKQKFKDIVKDQLVGNRLTGDLKVTFKLYKASNRRTDKSNFYSILSKFLYDAMQEFGCIEDDNDTIIKEELLLRTSVDKDYPRAEFTFEEIKLEGNEEAIIEKKVIEFGKKKATVQIEMLDKLGLKGSNTETRKDVYREYLKCL